MRELPDSRDARDFYRSIAFHHGLVIVDSLDGAIEIIERIKVFYVPDLFCGTLRQLRPVRHDSRTHPYSVDLRAHIHNDPHGWERDNEGHQLGQSQLGWQMVRDFQEALADRDLARTITNKPFIPDWTNFQW